MKQRIAVGLLVIVCVLLADTVVSAQATSKRPPIPDLRTRPMSSLAPTALQELGDPQGVPSAVIGQIRFDGVLGGPEGEDQAMEIYSIAWNVSVGSGMAPRPVFDVVKIVKAYDAASPFLAFDTALTTRLRSATITLCRTQDCPASKYMEYMLSDVIIRSIRHAGSGFATDLTTFEEITLDYAKIEWKFTTPSGRVVTKCWDVRQFRSC